MQNKLALLKISSQGQITLPKEMRSAMNEEQVLAVKSGNEIVLMSADKITSKIADEIETARRLDEKLEKIEAGEINTRASSAEDFLDMLEKI